MASSQLLYWCHQCDAEIMAAASSSADRSELEEQHYNGRGPEGERSRLICPDCGDGFIEAMETALTLRNVRRVIRRRRQVRRPRENGGDDAISSQEVLRVIRFLVSQNLELGLNSDETYDGISDTGEEILSRDIAAVPSMDSAQTSSGISGELIRTLETPHRTPEVHVGLLETCHGISEAHDGILDSTPNGSHERVGEASGQSDSGNAISLSQYANSEIFDGTSESQEVIYELFDGISDAREVGPEQILRESARPFHSEPPDGVAEFQGAELERYDEEGLVDEDGSESGAEGGLLELNGLESFEEEENSDGDGVGDEDDDDDEWEEVDFTESDLVVRFLEAVDGIEGETARDRSHIAEEDEVLEENRIVEEGEGSWGHRNTSLHSGNVLRRGLFRRWQTITRNYNSEIELDWFESDAYIGNPGDYVDAQGFEEILQQLMETDNTRRGAPPASRSAIEALPSIHIKQQNLDDGSAICAICKDVVALYELAKQLPCLHLYHSMCILPWLDARNSCPVCRYELPTDDSDYEEERKKINIMQHVIEDTHSLGMSEEPYGESPESNSNNEPSQVEGIEIECGTELNSLKNDAHVNDEEINSGNESDALGTNVMEMECGNESCAFRNGIESPNGLMNASGNTMESSTEVNALYDDANIEETESRNELEIDGSYADAKRKPSLVEMIAGPLFSVVGLIMVSCLGNLFLGKEPQKQQSFEQNAKSRRMEEVQKYKPWWMRLFG